jgi:hypothetical protein
MFSAASKVILRCISGLQLSMVNHIKTQRRFPTSRIRGIRYNNTWVLTVYAYVLTKSQINLIQTLYGSKCVHEGYELLSCRRHRGWTWLITALNAAPGRMKWTWPAADKQFVGPHGHQMLICANKPIATPRDNTRVYSFARIAAFAKISFRKITALVVCTVLGRNNLLRGLYIVFDDR